jgi:hypothetical protein
MTLRVTVLEPRVTVGVTVSLETVRHEDLHAMRQNAGPD